MGMDVYGKNPTAEVGGYFRASIWGWRPLAKFTEFACWQADAMDLFNQCEHWWTNDGDGLDAEGASKLADLIDGVLALKSADRDGVDAYVEIRDGMIAAQPDETCWLCKGSGIRTDELGQKHGMPFRQIPPRAFKEPLEWEKTVELLKLRDKLRAARRFEEADRIRDFLSDCVIDWQTRDTSSLDLEPATTEDLPDRIELPAERERHPRAGQRGWCNGCDGRGTNRPVAASYPLDRETILEWRDFLRHSGGFEIH